MEPTDNSEPTHLTDDVLSAFIETAQSDNLEREDREAIARLVQARLKMTMASLNYTPLTPESERFESEFARAFEKHLQAIIARFDLNIEEMRSLLPESTLYRVVRGAALAELDEIRFNEGGLLDYVTDSLLQFEQAMQDYPEQADQTRELYYEYKKRTFAHWSVLQHLPYDHPILRAVSVLFPGPEIDPTSDEMRPYFASAHHTLEENQARYKRYGEFHGQLYKALLLDGHSDPDMDKRRAVSLLIGHAHLFMNLRQGNAADREEKLREIARKEALALNNAEINLIIESINGEFPM